MEELLISLVRENPVLYDKRHPSYYDKRGVVANVWSSIAGKLTEEGYSQFQGKLL